MFKKKPQLQDRLAALESARAAGEPYLSAAELEPLDRVARAAAERRELSADHTVVGFFGATGSGKTSLFNAVVGEDLGKSSPRRPTTSSPLAAVWEPTGSEALLDWLDVEDRRNRSGEFAPGAGPLILLDLPDFDSVDLSNREIATRLAGQVDVLVWVTDPEKYADSVIHDQFIRPHANHSAVTLAVLNKADKLRDGDIRSVSDSFEQLLREDGLKKVRVVPTSAKEGTGIDDLRKAIAKVAQDHNAQNKRIEADLDSVTSTWTPGSSKAVAVRDVRDVPKSAKKDMDNLLSDAAGADELANATAAAYRKRLGQTTGWLLTSWMLKLKADPLRRLGLREEADEIGVHRTSLPELDASRKAISNKGVRAYSAAVQDGLPQAWASAVADKSEDIAESMPAHLDRAASGTKLPAQPSAAWKIFLVIQWLALLAALVGVGWYLMVAFLPGALVPLLGDDLTPEVEGWPIPTLLIMGGLLLGIVLGLVIAVFGGIIGAGVKARTRSALRKKVAEISQAQVVEPLETIRQDYAKFLTAVQAAAGK